jgi:hypothetical protein
VDLKARDFAKSRAERRREMAPAAMPAQRICQKLIVTPVTTDLIAVGP